MSFSRKYIIFVTWILIPSCFSTLFSPPKIRISFVCSTDQYVRLSCKYRQHLLDEKSDLINMIEDQHTFYFDDQAGTPIFLGLVCISHYPVKWNHFQEPWLKVIAGDNWLHVMRLQITNFQRIVKDFEKPASYRYASFRVVTNHITSDSNFALGEYTCDKMKKSGSLVKTMTKTTPVTFQMYRKMSIYDSVFPLSKKNVTIYMEEKREGDGSIVIPCHVSSPNVTVTLYKKIEKETLRTGNAIFIDGNGNTVHQRPGSKIEEKESWQLVHETINLRFQPQLGFVYVDFNKALNAPSQFLLTPGTYKCTAPYQSGTSSSTPSFTDEGNLNEDEEDWVIVQVVPGHKKVEAHEPFINPPASFNVSVVENNRFKVTCCSRSAIPPTFYFGSCISEDMCRRKMDNAITSQTNGAGLKGLAKVNGNCIETRNLIFGADYIVPEVFRCIGDGIDYRTEIIFPLDGLTQENNAPKRLPPPYMDWKDVDPYRMIAFGLKTGNLVQATTNNSVLLYENQNATFACTASVAYFALGAKATINFNNGTRFLVPEPKRPAEIFLTLFQHGAKIEFNVTVDSNVESTSCFAPLIDSAQWIEKRIKIIRKKGEMVSIKGSNQEVVNWVLNDTYKSLTCEFEGVPAPTIITWMKNGQLIINSTQYKTGDQDHGSANYLIRTFPSSNTSILQVGVVDYEIHGTYECLVQSVLGEARKSFHVHVILSGQTWVTISVLIGAVFLLSVFVLMAVTTWRQRQNLINITNPYEYQNGLI